MRIAFVMCSHLDLSPPPRKESQRADMTLLWPNDRRRGVIGEQKRRFGLASVLGEVLVGHIVIAVDVLDIVIIVQRIDQLEQGRNIVSSHRVG